MNVAERRVKLKLGEQKRLLFLIAQKLGSLKNVSNAWGLSYSTIKKYSQESLYLPEFLFERITEELHLNKNNLEAVYLDANWGMRLGGKKAMQTLERKYPDKLLEWRRGGIYSAIKMGKHKSYSSLKSIKYPDLNEKLSEFIGVYLGDGTLTKYCVRISGDCRYDMPYFDYLSALIFELFGLTSSIKKENNRNVINLAIYSKNLCSYLRDNFNLNYGDKIRNKSIIPEQILLDKKLAFACFRGLMDTDGSVSRRGRGGSQFCLHFSSHSKPLLNQVNKLGRGLGIFTYCDETGAGTNKWDNILRYFNIVGSSNLKHIIRFYLRAYDNKTIYLRDVPDYLEQSFYKDLNLPFRVKGPIG